MIDATHFIQKVYFNPTLAGRILTTLLDMAGQPATLQDIVELSKLLASEVAQARILLDSLCDTGVVVRKVTGWALEGSSTEVARLLLLIEGAEAAQKCSKDRDVVSLVVTYPGESSFLDCLKELSPYYASVPHTAETFMNIALGAEQRLVVMTPFLDEAGAEMVHQMFIAAAPEVKKALIVRSNAVTAPAGMMVDISQLAQVYDYMVAKEGGRFETFHSKAILADNRQAYVGSANMLNSSLSISLEMGFLVTGDAAAMLGRFIDSIITRLTLRQQNG